MASFFANASNVKINGGEFNVVHGNLTIYDQSRHTSNTNSFNATNTTAFRSHNDNSQQYNGGGGPPLPGRNPNASRGNGPPLDTPFNGSYFPPPAIHPALMGGSTQLPPGSTMANSDSFNAKQNIVDGSYNDNSRAYDVPVSAQPRVRNPNVGPQANPYSQQHASYAPTARNNYGDPSPPGSAHNQRGTPTAARGPGSQSPPGAGYYGHHPPSTYGRNTTTGQFVSGAQTRAGRGRTNRTIGNFGPGDMRNMSPEHGQQLQTLLQEITAPSPVDARQYVPNAQQTTEDSSGSSDDGSSDEEDETVDRPNINNGMANLSLADASTHPAYSRVKSDPQLPLSTHESISQTMNRDVPMHSESMPPQHSKEGVFMGQGPSAYPGAVPPPGNAHAQQQRPLGSTPSSAPSPLAQFGLDDKPNSAPGAIFNTYHGPVQKIDARHHITNINSGNTQNNLIKDSYNDNSMQSYAAPSEPEPGKPAKKNRLPRFW